jgi:hypothetical protein
MPKRPTLQRMQQSDKIDEAAIRAVLSGKPFPPPILLWHAPRIPTFANAYLLAKQHGIVKVSAEVSQTSEGDHVAIVRLRLPSTRSIRAGAGRHADPMIARGFAFRNAVRQLLLEVSP